MPNRHEEGSTYITDTKNRMTGTAVFYERKLGSFSKIERIGDSPAEYYWKVTTSDGIVNWYGGVNQLDLAYTLGSTDGISYWALKKTEDLYGNYIEYFYTPSEIVVENETLVTNLYLSTISYTGHNGVGGSYSVQ